MFLRSLLLLFLSFQFQLKAQTPEDIGTSIFDAFFHNRKSLFSNLKDSNALALRSDLIRVVENFNYNDSAKNKLLSDINNSDLKSFQKRYKGLIDGLWTKILREKYNCGLVAASGHLIKKDISNNQLQSELADEIYLLLFDKSRFAIRYYIVFINGKSYLKKLDERIYYPDDKGNFTCTSTCKNGKSITRKCIEITEE